MKEIWFCIFGAILLAILVFIGGNQRDDFQHCLDAVSERYPSSKPMPEGQPFKYVYHCMRDLGYVQDTQPLSCRYLDYTRAVMKEDCYRSTNIIEGYTHDLKMVFR